MTRTRRAVLAACGAGLTALAGCSSHDGDGRTPTYDTARLVALGNEDLPSHPRRFPVAVPEGMITEHRERARDLLDRVPEEPAVPNGVVRQRLKESRETVVEMLDARDAAASATGPLEGLGDARYVRGNAAAVEAAYRAATDDIEPRAVEDRLERLRSDLLGFERDWTYRGDDPATAAVVHEAFENLRRRVRHAITFERSFPATPSSAVFRAGEYVEEVEVGRASIEDAQRLRASYREDLSNPRSYWTEIRAAAVRIRSSSRRWLRDLDDYIVPRGEEPPFERDIAGTAVGDAYRIATLGVRDDHDRAKRASFRGAQSTALFEAGEALAELRGLDAIVTDIRNGRIQNPESVDDIAAARRAALEALERARATEPSVLAARLAHWPWMLIEAAADDLGGDREDDSPDTADAYRAFGNYVAAERVATAVPRTVADLQAALRTAPR